MKTIRWLFFVPIAILTAAIIGGLTQYTADYFLPEWLAWIMGGAFSGIAIVIVGLRIAPEISNKVKWILVITSVVFAIISVVGSILGENTVSALGGISMAIFSYGFAVQSIEDLQRQINNRS